MGVLNTVRSGLNVLFTPVLYGVVASLALQLSTWEKGDRTQDKMQDTSNPDILKAHKDTFDFIVVGGGTAGSVVSNRLSEFYSVLLLEAGGEPNPLVYMPGLARNLLNRPEVDWSHKTVAQKGACLLGQFKRAVWSQGKGLGGSGNLGWMVSLRGHEKDFDNWGKLVGNDEWEYERFRKYFKRHENFVGNTTDSEAHVQGGELTIQLPDYRPLASEFVWAGKELGYPNLDLNGRFNEGFDEIYYPSKKGEKLTTYKTFVEPIKRRDNLTIRKFASVTKILLRKGDHSAYGVEYERHGKKYTVYSAHEVIVSAGTVQSAKLLLHSGIGPKRHLEDVGIKPLVNLPVGRNLQDHLGVYLGPFFIKEPLSFDFDRDVSAKSFFEYGTFGTGPVTTTGFTATALLSSSFAKLRGEKDWPDLQLLMHAVSVHTNYAGDMAHAYGLNEEPLKKYYKHAIGRQSFHIVVSLARPYARGEIRLASRTPSNPVIIDPKYFEDPWDFDVKTMVEGVKKAVELIEGTVKFQGLGGHFTSEIMPGCDKQQFRSDDYWECYVRQYTVSMHNPVGSVTMGPVGSQHTVVDSQLRVLNVPGLRVVDAGVMPSIVIAGTQQATMAIAEKGAENILDYWKNKEAPSKVVKPDTSSREQIYSSSEVISFKSTAAPPPPPPPSPTITQTTPRANSFLDAFTLNPENKQNWQNTLDQLSQFSKQIQDTLQVTPVPSPYQTPTTQSPPPPPSTTRATPKPQFMFYQSSTPTTRPVTPSIGLSYQSPSTTTTRTTTPLVYVPLITLPTSQQVKISPHSSPTPKMTTYKPPKSSHYYSSSAPKATTFRPPEHEHFNRSMFSVNVPIIQANYKSISSVKPNIQNHQNTVQLYPTTNPGNSHKQYQTIVRKENQYKKFTTPYKSSPSPTTTPMPPTTTRRTMFEMIHSQVLPHGYQNYVEIPLTSVSDYQVVHQPSQSSSTYAPTRATTTTTTRRPTTTKRVVPPSSSMQIVPAVHITADALETTTTRYTVPAGYRNFGLSQIQTIPQDILLTGLEPYSLVDVTTASEVPSQYTTTTRASTSRESVSTAQTPLLRHQKQKQKQRQNLQTSSEKAPLYYVVRKKTKNNDQLIDYTDSIKLTAPPRQQQQMRNPHNQQPSRPQRPHHYWKPRSQRQQQQQRQQHRRPSRPQSHQSSSAMSTSQSQRQYPLVAYPPSHFGHPQRQPLEHYVTTIEDINDHLGMGSTKIHSIHPPPRRHSQSRRISSSSSVSDLDGIITPAISSPLYQQDILDQLIPIQK